MIRRKDIKNKVSGYRKWLLDPVNRLFLYLFRIVTIAAVALLVYAAYVMIYPNINNTKENKYLLVYENYTVDSIVNVLDRQHMISNKAAFKTAADVLGYYDKGVKQGRYKLKPGMSNFFLIKNLKSGTQTPSKVTLNSIRTLGDLSGRLSNYFKTDSAAFYKLLTDDAYLNTIGFTRENVMTVFLPNTYEMYWDTKPEKIIEKFMQERNKFWNNERKHKADSLQLNIEQVYTLASIVDKETNKADERPTIAGVYLNRLHQNMPLQADPTVVFANHDFTITRVMEKHTSIVSPYNTYTNVGLPPGPICMPDVSSIDAVLNAVNHSYMFFCAKPDLTGYHVFAITYEAHLQNARNYQEFLNKHGY